MGGTGIRGWLGEGLGRGRGNESSRQALALEGVLGVHYGIETGRAYGIWKIPLYFDLYITLVY